MKKLINNTWITITIILCVVFATLFLLFTVRDLGATKAILLALAGIVFIWLVYFSRAIIFSGFKDKDDPGEK
jgi:hypothetical protein